MSKRFGSPEFSVLGQEDLDGEREERVYGMVLIAYVWVRV